MPEISELLESLNEATEKSNASTSSASSIASKIMKAIHTAANTAAETKGYSLDDAEMQEIKTLIVSASSTDIASKVGVVFTYPNIASVQKNYSLNISKLYEYVVHQVKDHMSHPNKPFYADEIRGKSIAIALKQCCKNSGSPEYLSLGEFKKIYAQQVFGGFVKKKFFIKPNLSALCKSTLTCALSIKTIAKTLETRRISDLEKDFSSMMSEMVNKKISVKNVDKYIKAIRNAIDDTASIYADMTTIYNDMLNEQKHVLNYIIKHGPQSIEESAQDALFTSMNESADNSDGIHIPAEIWHNSKIERTANITNFSRNIFTAFNDIRNVYINPDITLTGHVGINTYHDSSKMLELTRKNTEKARSMLIDPYDACTMNSAAMMKEFIPEQYHDIIDDDATTSEMMEKIVKIMHDRMLGDEKEFKPDVVAIEANMVELLNILKILDVEIDKIHEHVNRAMEFTAAHEDELHADKRHEAIQSVLSNGVYVYLRILLGVVCDIEELINDGFRYIEQISSLATNE